MGMSCITGFVFSDGVIEYKPRYILRRYAKTWRETGTCISSFVATGMLFNAFHVKHLFLLTIYIHLLFARRFIPDLAMVLSDWIGYLVAGSGLGLGQLARGIRMARAVRPETMKKAVQCSAGCSVYFECKRSWQT